MNRPSSRKPIEQPEGLGFRLLAAIIAVPIFELSLYLGLYATVGARRSLYYFLSLPMWFHGAFIGLAIAVGLFSGFKGITWLLGHLFFTHFERDRNWRVTVALWAGIIALATIGHMVAN
jgi:hypothetical protein